MALTVPLGQANSRDMIPGLVLALDHVESMWLARLDSTGADEVMPLLVLPERL